MEGGGPACGRFQCALVTTANWLVLIVKSSQNDSENLWAKFAGVILLSRDTDKVSLDCKEFFVLIDF